MYSYSADTDGRVTRDGRQGLEISYDVTNFPRTIITDEGMSTTYTYLCDGTKRGSVYNWDSSVRLYRGSFVYEAYYNNVDGTYDSPALEGVSTPEGRLAVTEGGHPRPVVCAGLPGQREVRGEHLRVAGSAGA